MSHAAPAASVLLARGSDAAELFVVRRAASLRFLGGFLAFPGGKVCAADRTLNLVDDQETAGRLSFSPEYVVAAARELFEETGVLLARRPDGSFPSHGLVLAYLRRKMATENLEFATVLSRLGLTLRVDDFRPLGRLTTPPFIPTRFDTAFFLARLPANQQAEVWQGELEAGEWASATSVLERWRRGECLVSPPTLVMLQALQSLSVAEIPDRLIPLFAQQAEEELAAICFAPNVYLIPLHTSGLPPSTHTNAYLIGRGPVYLLDPGSSLQEEQQRLFAVLDAHAADGRPLTAIVLTHHHPDHTGGVLACARRYRVPVYAHPWTAQRLRDQVPVHREIQNGDQLDLGAAPDSGGPWFLEAIHTPGHAPGHLSFYERHYRLLFVGDMVSTLSSIVIAPPDGDLVLYLESLRRLRTYDCQLLLPAHGSPTAQPGKTIDEFLAHRMKREAQLLAVLGSKPGSVADLAQALYNPGWPQQTPAGRPRRRRPIGQGGNLAETLTVPATWERPRREGTRLGPPPPVYSIAFPGSPASAIWRWPVFPQSGCGGLYLLPFRPGAA